MAAWRIGVVRHLYSRDIEVIGLTLPTKQAQHPAAFAAASFRPSKIKRPLSCAAPPQALRCSKLLLR